ncbi:Uncharacterised protein [Ectopseudomonas mendocina]|uniref:Uncharacterized protein n=1 Tax=Ectopseudomonas mendocina TaxID=300 RepID=A0A379PPA7_ECTME|nr:hypothetical protein [Pseudomonas mendocina]SUE95833.1 Uncharacterised protein [Pseudomonas mendocina]
MSNIQASEDQLYPVEKSMSGKNAFYHFCDVRGNQQSYAVCMHTVKAIEENRVKSDQFIECQRACTHDTCPAKAMRAEERAAGHALYYKERIDVNPANTRSEAEAQANALTVSSGKYDMNNPSYARGWAQVGYKLGKDDPSKPIKHKPAFKNPPAPSPAKKSGYVEEGMADLVNELMKDQPKKAQSPSPTTAIKPMPGETPIEFAKRRAAMLRQASA